MSKFGVNAEESLMIGDTVTDIEFAHNANMRIICPTFGAHTRQILENEKPYAFITIWYDLYEYLL
jgi:phosphoglycolate phosphatase